MRPTRSSCPRRPLRSCATGTTPLHPDESSRCRKRPIASDVPRDPRGSLGPIITTDGGSRPTDRGRKLVPALAVTSPLVPEVIGLLFDDLGLDDTLTTSSALALVHDLASLRDVPHEQTEPIVTLFVALLDRAAEVLRAREEVAAEARQSGLTVEPWALEAAQRVLVHTPRRRPAILAFLHDLPVAQTALTLTEFDFEYRGIAAAYESEQRTWSSLQTWVLPSVITDLDVVAEARALRESEGVFRWLRRAPSKDARRRVEPHFVPHHRGLSSAEMVNVLERVANHLDAEARLEARVAGAHPWVGWACAVEGRLHELRVRSLRWFLERVEEGDFGASEQLLLTDSSRRTLLGSDSAVRWVRALRAGLGGADRGPAGVDAVATLERLRDWLAQPPAMSYEQFEEFRGTLMPVRSQVACALVNVQSSKNDASLDALVKNVLELTQGAFGGADSNRRTFRSIVAQVSGDVEGLRSHLAQLRPKHPHLVSIVGELRGVLRAMHDDLRVQAPASGPLRVAIAGRTKAGKTTLRRVLMRDLTQDPSLAGIGRGAHRTTRTAEAFSWDQLTFVDTPGVSAKDDEYDAAVAVDACRDADAVVWMFAESLRDEESQILQTLLTVKPVLVVYNAKGRVDSATRLGAFVRNPHLTFTDEAGHAERSRQMAAAAGVRAPMFLAVHASAARRALIAGGETHPAWTTSRVPQLESELHRVLSVRARGLRSLHLADQVRTPLLAAAARAATVGEELKPRCETARSRLEHEEASLLGGVDRALAQARSRIHKNFASRAAALPMWVEETEGGDDLDRAWSDFLSKLGIDSVLAEISTSLEVDVRASGILLDRQDQLEEKLQKSRLAGARRKGVPLLTRAWRIISKFGGLLLRRAPQVRKAGMGVPGWIALALDVVVTVGRAVTREVSESRIGRRQWQQDAYRAARQELDRVRRKVVGHLERLETELRISVRDHFAQARTEVEQVVQCLGRTDALQSSIAESVKDVDRLMVERLVQLGGLRPGQIIRVDRVPNLHLDVTVAERRHDIEECLRSVLDGCIGETITVTEGQRHRGRMKGLTK